MDVLGNPLSYAQVQLKNVETKGVLEVKLTSTDGDYSFFIDNPKEYLIKASYLGMKSTIKTIDVNTHIKNLNLILTDEENMLDTVVIDYEPQVLERNDTIVFNLKELTNGKETNLKEIIGKLPGVNLDSNGKILVKGKKVGKLLIDGEAFFGGQHQLATQNINANMISGVSFFNKYKDFENVENFNNAETTALNIEIKQKYKNKITGNIEANLGVTNKFLGHTNLFRLGKKLKITFIGDINNIAKQALSYSDYAELNTLSKPTQKGSISSYEPENLPEFLQETTSIASRDVSFGAVNFIAKPTKKLLFEGFSIVNQTSQNQFFNLKRTATTSGVPDQLEKENKIGDFFFNTTHFNLKYKTGLTSNLGYTFTYNPTNDNEESTIVNFFNNEQFVYDQNTDRGGFMLGQRLQFNQKINKKLLLEAEAGMQLSDFESILNIKSNLPFLGLDFGSDNFGLIQNAKQNSKKHEGLLQLTHKSDYRSILFKTGITSSNRDILIRVRGIDDPKFDNNLSGKLVDNFADLTYQSFTDTSFNYKLALSYHYFSFRLSPNTFFGKPQLFPYVELSYKLGNHNIIELVYEYSNQFVPLGFTSDNGFVTSYRNLYMDNNINFSDLLPKETFSLDFRRSKLNKGIFLWARATYYNDRHALVNNAEFIDNYTINQYRFSDTKDRFFGFVDYRKQFNKSKISVRFNLNYGFERAERFVNDLGDVFKVNKFGQKISVVSNFKSNINFNLGADSMLYKYRFETSDFINKWSTLNLSAGVNATLFDDYLTVSLNALNRRYDTATLFRSLYIINPSVRYNKPDSKWEFFIKGENILNLSSAEIAENKVSDLYISQSVSSSLQGFLVLGVKYSF